MEIVMEGFFVLTWWATAMRGLMGILFGVLALAWPGLTLVTLVILFAAWALLVGIASVAGALRHGRGGDEWWGALLLGVVSIGAGIVAALHPALTALVLVLVMGANALVVGVIDILAAIRLRQVVAHEWLLAVAGLVSVVFGACVFLFPGAGALALVWMISLYAIVSGALLLALALRMRTHAQRSARQAERRVLHDRRMSAAR
jgi:uncharacterized membrane protein HdeD (DUF308 family)